MKKFILFLFLGVVGWYYITEIPLKLYTTEDPEVVSKTIEKLMELSSQKVSNCDRFYILFVPQEEDPNSINVVVQCNKWGI